MDQSKKTMRHFYCRDVMWDTFEQMATDFDCSIDYLVNEAMRYYARSKNYQVATAGASESPQSQAAEELARRPEAKAMVPQLIVLAEGPDAHVRQGACEALGYIKSQDALGVVTLVTLEELKREFPQVATPEGETLKTSPITPASNVKL